MQKKTSTFFKAENSRTSPAQKAELLWSPHISRARDLCNVPHQMETPSLWTFALLPDQTFLLDLKPFVPSVSFVLLRWHRGDTEKNQRGMPIFMKLESDDASRTNMSAIVSFTVAFPLWGKEKYRPHILGTWAPRTSTLRKGLKTEGRKGVPKPSYDGEPS